MSLDQQSLPLPQQSTDLNVEKSKPAGQFVYHSRGLNHGDDSTRKNGDGETLQTAYTSRSAESRFEITSVIKQGEANCENEPEATQQPRTRSKSLPNIEKDIGGKVDERVLKEIACKLKRRGYDWKMLACKLELKVEIIHDIEEENEEESNPNFEVLKSWQDAVYNSVTQDAAVGCHSQLYQALSDLDFQRIAHLIPNSQTSSKPFRAKTSPAPNNQEDITLWMLSQAAEELRSKSWDTFRECFDDTKLDEIVKKYELIGKQENSYTRCFWALVEWKRLKKRIYHDFDLLLRNLGFGDLAERIVGKPEYKMNCKHGADHDDEGLLQYSKGQKMVDLEKLNELAKAVFPFTSGKRGTCFFIYYENGTYLITACHSLLKKSYMKSIQENGLDSLREEVRKRVGCAAIFTRQDSQTKVSKLIGHQDEKVYFCNDLIAIKVSGTELPASCRPIKIKSSVKEDIVNENCFLSILHFPYSNFMKFNYGMVVSKQSLPIEDVTILNYYMDTADGSSGAPVLMAHCDDGVPEAEYHVVGVHKGKTKTWTIIQDCH